MRILTILMGILLAGLGVFSILNAGLAFIAVAFPIGLGLMLTGMVECFAYKKAVDDEEDKHWILIEGLTTFFIGIVVISGQVAADIAVPQVFGIWSLISGIRGLVVLFMSGKEEKNANYYWELVTAILAALLGIAAFFNNMLFNWSVLMIVGWIIAVQAAVVIKISFSIAYKKPDLIKSKDEKVRTAKKEAAKAKKEMKIAIKRAREAKEVLKEVEENAQDFHEIIAEPVELEPIIIKEPVEPSAEEPTQESTEEAVIVEEAVDAEAPAEPTEEEK